MNQGQSQLSYEGSSPPGEVTEPDLFDLVLLPLLLNDRLNFLLLGVLHSRRRHEGAIDWARNGEDGPQGGGGGGWWFG